MGKLNIVMSQGSEFIDELLLFKIQCRDCDDNISEYYVVAENLDDASQIAKAYWRFEDIIGVWQMGQVVRRLYE